jgi:hypothetical protein
MPCWMTRPQPWEPDDDPFATLEIDLVNGMKSELGYDKAAKDLKKFEYPREEEGRWLSEATALLKTREKGP